MSSIRAVAGQFTDKRWRLSNLYHVTDKTGAKVRFRMNWAQEALFDNMHFLNTILKARQLGFSTFIQLYILDDCLFHANIRGGVIAHTREDAQAIFKDKVRFPYDCLPEGLKAAVPATQDSAQALSFANNSSVRVGTSLRSGTFQCLHISEFGKIAALYPDKAREIRTGALNTVQAGQKVWIESTAEGQAGDFHDLCVTGMEAQRRKTKLTALDFKFHFFPWWKEQEYTLAPEGVEIPSDMAEYFAKLLTIGIDLTPEQKAWYVKKAEQQRQDMKREFPSTPEEAFEASIEGAYYGDQIAALEEAGKICAVPHDPAVPVETWWDLGIGDAMAVWFIQRVGREIHVIDYYENSGEGIPHYAKMLAAKPYTYSEHILPHDAEARELGSGKTRVETFKGLVGKAPHVVPRQSVEDGIEASRNILSLCWFDAEKCSEGLKALKNYRKEWDDKLATWKDKPRHDWASHGSDAFRTGAMYRPSNPRPKGPKSPKLNIR